MNIHNSIRKVIGINTICGMRAACLVVEQVTSNQPTMIARFGSVEIKGVLYPRMPFPMRITLRNKILGPMRNNAGFFPSTPDMIERFSALMIEDMKQLDVLGSWRIEERFLRKQFPTAKLVELKQLEPYFSENPWTQALEGKRVLVVHPFSATIYRQYHENREFLFSDKRILPQFASLNTIKAVQTIAGVKSEYKDWFEALDSMKSAIDASDYDVAILGCGAYGFPLAAHVKRQGKIAIHLGGPTQILFGIRGKRWDNHPVISKFYNEHWVRPALEDVPQNAVMVEGGCYW